MTIDRTSLPSLQAQLASNEQHRQEQRAVLGSTRISSEDKMRALQELARLSSDLTSLLLDVIRTDAD